MYPVNTSYNSLLKSESRGTRMPTSEFVFPQIKQKQETPSNVKQLLLSFRLIALGLISKES